MTAKPGGVIGVSTAPGKVKADADDFLRVHGYLFGIVDPVKQLVQRKTFTDSLQTTHASFEQVHKGVPVFSGVIRLHQNGAGDFTVANGDFYPIPNEFVVIPQLSSDAATAKARERLSMGRVPVESAKVVIVDPGWYGDPTIGPHLAYYLVLADVNASVREAFFVDAGDGTVLDQWSLIHTARVREIYDGGGAPAIPGALVRSEGEPPVASPIDANRAYDYLGDAYDYFARAFGRDGIDGSGMTIVATVYSTHFGCPNAAFVYWANQLIFCEGTVTDDVTVHEFVHGLTEYSSQLMSQDQPGQLNESFSDIFGELVDLFNGDCGFPGPPGGTPWPPHSTGSGLDSPNSFRAGVCSPDFGLPDGARWLIGEELMGFDRPLRDMWDPTCYGHPDRANSPLQICGPGDNGAVHSGSGVMNHALAIVTDGKSFNGYSVNGIGPIKSGAVWYRALVTYLTPASDFSDAYAALNQAAQDLIGTFPNDPRTGFPSTSMFTAADAEEVTQALLATEMDTEGRCGYVCPSLGAAPSNDNCENATVSVDGANAFSTVDAAIPPDGPSHFGQCGLLNLAKDIWFEYTSSCTGRLTASLCGSDAGLFEGYLMVYGDHRSTCACPPPGSDALACDNQFCSAENSTSYVESLVVEGGCYLIRIADSRTAGSPGWGCGTLNLSCTPSIPEAPLSDPSGIDKCRFISFDAGAGASETALRVRLQSVHHVNPPYTGGPSIPFTTFEGQVRWVGPPTQYVESSASGIPFHTAQLHCEPHYQDWSTVGMLHVTGSAVTPSSTYEVENVGAICMGSEANCAAVSAPLTVSTTRWGDVSSPYNPPDPSVQPDISDVSALVDKFRNAPGAPIKARGILAGEPGNPFGEITPAVLSVDFGFSHISACVDAFRGAPYPYAPASCP